MNHENFRETDGAQHQYLRTNYFVTQWRLNWSDVSGKNLLSSRSLTNRCSSIRLSTFPSHTLLTVSLSDRRRTCIQCCFLLLWLSICFKQLSSLVHLRSFYGTAWVIVVAIRWVWAHWWSYWNDNCQDPTFTHCALDRISSKILRMDFSWMLIIRLITFVN